MANATGFLARFLQGRSAVANVEALFAGLCQGDRDETAIEG